MMFSPRFISVDAALWACSNGAVRLRDGITSSEGRVEVCIDGRWGTVCAGGGGVVWDANDATVVCNQLFNTSTKSTSCTHTHTHPRASHMTSPIAGGFPTVGKHGAGMGPIFLNNLGCFGNEANLLECLNSGLSFVANCNHTQDVGVACYGECVHVPVTCTLGLSTCRRTFAFPPQKTNLININNYCTNKTTKVTAKVTANAPPPCPPDITTR